MRMNSPVPTLNTRRGGGRCFGAGQQIGMNHIFDINKISGDWLAVTEYRWRLAGRSLRVIKMEITPE
jgi:hypothetical protein